ncbi:MAG: phage integrase N-terminal SAM-like domain-containing protein [Candidatus Omnitrophica bacterium]|nr:phage integrase N-terminal SAM-like domain-containing protein [Candidatus Omnitrophota bacterium]
MFRNILPDFQSFLRSHNFVQEKHIPYYAYWASQFLSFSNNHKNLKIDLRIQSFLQNLQNTFNKGDWQIRRVSASTQNQAFNALLFLFRNILHIEVTNIETAIRAKRGEKLPVAFTIEEIQELFKHITGKTRLVLQLLYGSGLRISEVVRSRVKYFDFTYNTITVRSSNEDSHKKSRHYQTCQRSHFKAQPRNASFDERS